MPSIRIPSPLRSYTDAHPEVQTRGETVYEALQDLVRQYPTLKTHLFNNDGTLRPYVNLFLGEENVMELAGMQTPLKPEDRLLLLPSIAGGNPYAS